ncbi:MAG: hypothetical protein JXR48_18120 [Candidatus Delongbacteria bacterium]|nr:hypothetical protein [Candidatus Delongbacteria bacterium]MBN2836877.1 hypothetical protein [Candidatus Delongbacteria bacterium]
MSQSDYKRIVLNSIVTENSSDFTNTYKKSKATIYRMVNEEKNKKPIFLERSNPNNRTYSISKKILDKSTNMLVAYIATDLETGENIFCFGRDNNDTYTKYFQEYLKLCNRNLEVNFIPLNETKEIYKRNKLLNPRKDIEKIVNKFEGNKSLDKLIAESMIVYMNKSPLNNLILESLIFSLFLDIERIKKIDTNKKESFFEEDDKINVLKNTLNTMLLRIEDLAKNCEFIEAIELSKKIVYISMQNDVFKEQLVAALKLQIKYEIRLRNLDEAINLCGLLKFYDGESGDYYYDLYLISRYTRNKNSLNYLNKAKTIFKIGKNYQSQIWYYITSGIIEHEKKDYVKALYNFRKLIDFSNLYDSYYLLIANQKIGNLYYSKLKFKNAIEYLTIALDIAENEKEIYSQITLINNITKILYQSRQLKEAEIFANKISLKMFKVMTKEQMINFLFIKANIYFDIDKIAKSINIYESIVNIIKSDKRFFNLHVKILNKLSICYKTERRFKKSITLLKQSIKLDKGKENLFNSYISFGLTYKEINAIDKSISYFLKAYKLSCFQPYLYLTGSVVYNLTLLYISVNDIKSAMKYLQEGISIYRSLIILNNDPNFRKRLKELNRFLKSFI